MENPVQPGNSSFRARDRLALELSDLHTDVADVPGASVTGATPAMEFYLELAPGGTKAIDVPSEDLFLLSMAQWSSSDPSACTVTADSGAGKVTAVAHRAGECDLTASLGFYTSVCHVTVA